MMDFGWDESSRYNSRKQNTQSSLFSLTHPARYELLGKEPRFPSTSKVNFTHFVSHELSTECPAAIYKLQQRPLDLQLSADEFINHVEKFPVNGNCLNSIEGPIDFTLSLGRSSNPEDLKLFLAVDRDGDRNIFMKNHFSSLHNVIDLEEGTTNFFRKRTFFSHNVIDLEEGATGNFFGKKTISSSHNVFDLEKGTMGNIFRKKFFASSHDVIDMDEPVDRISGYAKSGPSLDSGFLEISPKVRQESKDLAIPEPFRLPRLKEIPSLDIAESNSFQEYSECFQGQACSSEGVEDDHYGVRSESKMQQPVSFQGLFDLNKALQYDSSCCSDDCFSEGNRDGLNGSMDNGTCPSAFWEKEVIRCPNETSGMLKQDKIVNLALPDLNRNIMKDDIWSQNSGNNSACGSVVTLASPDSANRFPEGTPDPGSCSNGHKNNTTERRKQEVSCDKSADNLLFSGSQNSLQERYKSSASCRSNCISDNDSSSGKTLHSGITFDSSDQCIKPSLGSQVAEAVRDEHAKRTSDRSDSQNEFYSSKEKSSEADLSLQEAAKLLVHMSSNETENQKREKPQYSIDSFELNTLNLIESSLDVDSVSSKPPEVNNTDAKEFVLKLRRGRRMKDFQKEILPGLASLSRQEIIEDINIMEGALRSREYRKNRATMVNCGDNWSATLRSRRSRVKYGGRRN